MSGVSVLQAPKVRGAGSVFPLPLRRTDQDQQIQDMARGVNLMAAGFYTAQSILVDQSGEDTITSATWVDLSGLTYTVAVPTPARAIVQAVIELSHDQFENAGLQFRLVVGSTAISSTRTYRPAALTLEQSTAIKSVAVQATTNLLPETAYILKAQAQVENAADSYKVRTASTMLIRVESRSIR